MAKSIHNLGLDLWRQLGRNPKSYVYHTSGPSIMRIHQTLTIIFSVTDKPMHLEAEACKVSGKLADL